MRCILLISCVVLWAGLFHIGLSNRSAAQPKPAEPIKQPETEPPYKRLLKGDDAKKVRDLKNKIVELRMANKYDEAIPVAKEILLIRTRMQGETHWQTADAQRLVLTLNQIVTEPRTVKATHLGARRV